MQQHMILDCGTRHNQCKAFAGTQVTVRSTVMLSESRILLLLYISYLSDYIRL